jgi:hypothetical protein
MQSKICMSADVYDYLHLFFRLSIARVLPIWFLLVTALPAPDESEHHILNTHNSARART